MRTLTYDTTLNASKNNFAPLWCDVQLEPQTRIVILSAVKRNNQQYLGNQQELINETNTKLMIGLVEYSNIKKQDS